MTDCVPGLFRRRGAHRFEARFDRSEPVKLVLGEHTSHYGSITTKATGDAALKRITYVRDICVRCGETIERKQ